MSSRAPHLTLSMGPLLEKATLIFDLHKDLLKVNSVPVSSSSQASSSASQRRDGPTYTEEINEKDITAGVLKLLVDPIADVKNNAVLCIGSMVKRARANYLKDIVNDLLAGISVSDKENEDQEGRRDISCLALKGVVLEMPIDGQATQQNVENMINKILPLLTKPSPDPQLASELLQILTDIYTRFSSFVATSQSIQSTSIGNLVKILSTGRLPIRKRAIPALSALISSNPTLFDNLKHQIVDGLKGGGDSAKVWSAVVASLARGQSAGKIGGLINEGKVVDLILGQTEDVEDVDTTEGALTALEALILRCPTETAASCSDLAQRGIELIKYDPNFVDVDEDDVDMNGDEDEDEDDEFDMDGYSDDEDDSWKVRKSAAKMLHALIGTRNDLISDYYKTTSPVLISRMTEREESVRLEVFAAYEALLRQTATARQAELASGGRNKRKRSQGMDEDSAPEDSVVTYLQASLPQVTKAILKQINTKSIPTKQQCFVLLRLITEALSGGLESSGSQITAAAATALRTVDSATTSSLAISALSFLSAFFSYHPSRVYLQHLKDLVSGIVRCMKDKLQRISMEAFTAASALAQSIRSQGSQSPIKSDLNRPIQSLFTATTEVLGDTSVDAEVRERALQTLGDLLVCEGDILTASYEKALPLITDRLANESTANTAVLVIGKIAESSNCKGDVIDQWLLQILPDVVTALRRSRRSTGKSAESNCLSAILDRIGSKLPLEVAASIISELATFIDQPSTIQTVGLILLHQPKVQANVQPLLPSVYVATTDASSANSASIDCLISFFSAYTIIDPDSATRIVPALVENLGRNENIPEGMRGGLGAYSTTAKIVGVIVKESQRNAAGILATFQKTIKSSKATSADLSLALLCIGEIGRNSDLSTDPTLFDKVLDFMGHQDESIRGAAAFAAGNLAVGSPSNFLPKLVKQIETSQTAGSRGLLLQALKEVILHTSSAQLESIADQLWKPLFVEDTPSTGKKGDELGDDGVRNVKAACIGKLTTTAPAKFLPHLQKLLKSSPGNRALVAAAVRYTFIDTSSAYDELIAPIIVDFLSLMHDENLVVRRLSLASLNAAIQNKPHLIVDRLATLQPLLYQETVVKPELQRQVMMGPFKMTEDDGLENRKTAYEAMYTLLATCFNKIDLPSFTERVMAAINDINEIKVLGLMLLLRLGQLSPTSVIPRLDAATDAFRTIMKDVEVKEDTIKQDLLRKEEMQRSALRTAVPLYRISTAQQAPEFHRFVQGLLQNQWKEYATYQG